VLALLATRCAPSTVERLRGRVAALSVPGPSIRGAAVAGVEGLPARRRGEFIAQLQVFCRLRGDTPELHTAEQLSEYLQSYDGLLTQLRAAWEEEAHAD